MAERMTMGEAGMVFTASDVDFQKVADRVERSARSVAATMQKSGSIVEKFMHAFRGREIINQLGEGLLRVSKAAADMSVKVRMGEASIGELVEEAAKGIPILGKFFAAGRDIREIITGEKAYTEVLAAQTKLQEDRADALERYLNLQKTSGRQLDDLNKRLEQKPGLRFDLGSAFTGGKRSAEDLRGNLNKQFAPALADLDKLRKQFGQKIIDLTARAQEPDEGTGARDAILQEIEDWQRRIAVLDKRATELRATRDKLEQASQLTIGRETLTKALEDIGGSLGAAATRGFGQATAAIDRYLARIPEVSDETKAAVEAALTPFQKLGQKMATFRFDLARGLKQKDFEKISFNALFETAIPLAQQVGDKIQAWVAPAQQFGQKVSDAFAAATTAQDAIRDAQLAQLQVAAELGSREAKTAADKLAAEERVLQIRKRLQDAINNPNLDAGSRKRAQEQIDALPALQAAMVRAASRRTPSIDGLTEMSRRIQQAAGGTDNTTRLTEQQLKEQQKANQFNKITADAMQQLLRVMPTVGKVK